MGHSRHQSSDLYQQGKYNLWVLKRVLYIKSMLEMLNMKVKTDETCCILRTDHFLCYLQLIPPLLFFFNTWCFKFSVEKITMVCVILFFLK